MPSEEWQAVRNVAMLQLALERTHLSLKLEGALKEQARWLQAIAQQLEEGP